MDQRKLMDNANTITDMAKVYRAEKITPRVRVKAALKLSPCQIQKSTAAEVQQRNLYV